MRCEIGARASIRSKHKIDAFTEEESEEEYFVVTMRHHSSFNADSTPFVISQLRVSISL